MIYPSFSSLVSAGIVLTSSSFAVANAARMRQSLHSQFGIKKAISSGTPILDSQIGTAAAGEWFKETFAVSCGEAESVESGYRMNYCAEDVDGESSEYRIYTCEQNSETGEILLHETKYSNSDCSSLVNTTSYTFTDTCDSGMTFSCGTSNSNAVISTFPIGGLGVEEYDTSESCSAATAASLTTYFGGRGCIFGYMFGEDSAVAYANEDCTGDIILEEPYSDIPDCGMDSVDDYDDTYDFLVYDNLYMKGYYGASAIDPNDWTGTYPDSLFGGEFKVCVTLHSGVYYGQALFSQVGYMRGTIDPSTNDWTGNWYMAGIEGRRGAFSFSLSAGAMTGTFTESNGAQETVTSTRSSSTEPSPLECFRADPEYLDTTSSFSYAGNWWVGWVDRNVFVDSNNLLTGSYDYGDNFDVPGWYYGYVHENGQVAQLQWYEEANFEGIYLFAAKNATSQYILWWGFDRISDFNYAKKNMDHWNTNGFGTRVDYKKSDVTDYSLANAHYCYQLITPTFEEECLQRASSDMNNNNTISYISNGEADDDEALIDMVGATLALVLIGMIASLVVCGLSLKKQNGPMAGATASDSKL